MHIEITRLMTHVYPAEVAAGTKGEAEALAMKAMKAWHAKSVAEVKLGFPTLVKTDFIIRFVEDEKSDT